jgi:phosphoenolpyruvate carboxykinase (ATP)
MQPFHLKDHELNAEQVHHNLPPSALYEHAIRFEKDTSIAESGALVAYSGAKTGRSPKDKRIKIRVICSRPYHALFMHTMLIRPTPQELAGFGKPDFVIYNAGAFPSNRLTVGVGSKTSIDLSLEDRELIILGTEYAGEMKKGVFTVANYLAPKRDLLSMHCSATADKETGRSSLLFGLSGTGKTTLSADPNAT